MPLDAKQYYLIRTTSGGSLLCRRGLEAPKITGGGARYDVVTRPRRKATVQWNGDDPYRMDLPILLDGWATGPSGLIEKSVEPDVAKINQLRQAPNDLVPPTELYVDGGVPVKGAKWVVEDITWGDTVIWSAKTGSEQGFRLRQDATLHLLQSVPLAVITLTRAPSATTPYIVKTGDTLASIAAKFNVTVPDIKKANTIRDPKNITKFVGQSILIPPAIKGIK